MERVRISMLGDKPQAACCVFAFQLKALSFAGPVSMRLWSIDEHGLHIESLVGDRESKQLLARAILWWSLRGNSLQSGGGTNSVVQNHPSDNLWFSP